MSPRPLPDPEHYVASLFDQILLAGVALIVFGAAVVVWALH